MDDEITHRTDGERKAYAAGYSAALNDVFEKGLNSAIEQMRAFVSAEGMIEERQ